MLFNFDKVPNQTEIGYIFRKDHWGKVYGFESVALVTDFAFNSLKLHKVHGSVVEVNV